MTETKSKMVKRRTERRKKRYGFYRDHPSSSRRQNRASLRGRAGEKTPSNGFNHLERCRSGSHFSRGRRETAAVGGSSGGTSMGIQLGNGIELVSERDLQSEGRTGNARIEVPEPNKSAQSAVPAKPRADPDFLTWKMLYNQRRAFRAMKSEVPRPAPVKKKLFEEEAFEFGAKRPGPDHDGSSSSETDHDDEAYKLGFSESEISLSGEDISGDEVDKAGLSGGEVGSDPDHSDSLLSETDHDDQDYKPGLSENDESEN